MKLKDITPAQIAEVKAHRAILQKQLGKKTGAQNKLDKLLKQQSTLQAEIQELERSEPSSENARQLSEKRIEIELVEKRLAELPPNNPVESAAMQALVREAVQILNRILAPTMWDYLNPIIAAVRPFVTSDAQANRVARETDAYKALRKLLFFNAQYTTAMRVISRYDEVLADEIAFSFNPKIS